MVLLFAGTGGVCGWGSGGIPGTQYPNSAKAESDTHVYIAHSVAVGP